MVNFEQPPRICASIRRRMIDDISGYTRLCELCDEELAAATDAETNDARIGHLEQAFRLAQRASKKEGGTLGDDRSFDS